jgi:hypothetical protein
MPIGGVIPTDILTARFPIFNYAFPGDPFTAGGQFGLRKEAKLSFEPVVRKATEGRDWQDAKHVKAEMVMWQDTYPQFKTMLLLSQFFPQLQAEMSNALWWNLVENTNATTPNGSVRPCITPEFECTPTDVMLKCMISGKAFNNEMDWMLANTSKHAGSTGVAGTASGAASITTTQLSTGYRVSLIC